MGRRWNVERADYGNELYPGEPAFVIRGNDVLAVSTLNLYIVNAKALNLSREYLKDLEDVLDAFLDYQEFNRNRVKVPD